MGATGRISRSSPILQASPYEMIRPSDVTATRSTTVVCVRVWEGLCADLAAVMLSEVCCFQDFAVNAQHIKFQGDAHRLLLAHPWIPELTGANQSTALQEPMLEICGSEQVLPVSMCTLARCCKAHGRMLHKCVGDIWLMRADALLCRPALHSHGCAFKCNSSRSWANRWRRCVRDMLHEAGVSCILVELGHTRVLVHCRRKITTGHIQGRMT